MDPRHCAEQREKEEPKHPCGRDVHVSLTTLLLQAIIKHFEILPLMQDCVDDDVIANFAIVDGIGKSFHQHPAKISISLRIKRRLCFYLADGLVYRRHELFANAVLPFLECPTAIIRFASTVGVCFSKRKSTAR